MTLEHLVDQYWFPKLGLLISSRASSGAIRFSARFRKGFSSSVNAIVDRPCADGRQRHLFYRERLERAPRIAGEHLLIAGSEQPNYGHYLQDIVPLIDLGARIRAPMLTWTLSPGSGASSRGSTFRRDSSAKSGRGRSSSSSRRQQQVQRREQPERRIRKPGSFRAKSWPMSARPRRRFDYPSRVLICRSPSNSRNLVNRAAMIEALKPLGFAADPAGETHVRRTGAYSSRRPRSS